MKICIVGAGAIGAMVGIQLARAGHEVTFICRGAQLAAARERGFRLILDDGKNVELNPVDATDKIAGAGPQDLVILAMKAHQVAAVVPDLAALTQANTLFVTMQNGIPWWYFQKCPGPYEGQRIEAVDPGGLIQKGIEIDRVVGSVVYLASEIEEPGVIRHVEGDRISFGELDGAESPRVQEIAKIFREAGFKSRVLTDIRSEIWLKLWGNASFNPISALSHATLAEICKFPLSRELVARMMAEIQAVGEALGSTFRVSIDRRIAGAAGVGEHKTSMLQDVEQGRTLELDALIGAVVELGKLTGIAMPHVEAVNACVYLLNQTLERHKGRLAIATQS